MPGVVVGSALDLAGAHRQQWLRTVKRLDLRFLVDTQHQRPFRRRHVEADNVTDLLDEEGIVGELERLAPVGLQAESAPDAMDGGWHVADRPGHQTERPVRRPGRRCLQRQADRLGDLVVTDRTNKNAP